jgi:hydrogenase maturation protease
MNELEWRLLEEKTSLEHVRIFDMDLRPGDRVRLRPQRGGDILDIALAGQTATIEAIEQDYEDRIHLAVILDDDPGRDLGLLRQPGHRFFFSPEEVEPLRPEEREGIGR